MKNLTTEKRIYKMYARIFEIDDYLLEYDKKYKEPICEGMWEKESPVELSMVLEDVMEDLIKEFKVVKLLINSNTNEFAIERMESVEKYINYYYKYK